MTKRIFIAIKVVPNNNLVEEINDLKRMLFDSKIKWVNNINLHLTLKFIGNLKEEKLIEINQVLTNSISNTFHVFSFSLTGFGLFGNINSPKALWFGIKPKEKLQTLNNIIENSLENIGITKSEKRFSPHLTIGRIKYLKNKDFFYNFLEKKKEKVFQTIQVSEIIIYESILKETGPVYVELHKIALKK